MTLNERDDERLQFALKHARQGTVELGVESAMALACGVLRVRPGRRSARLVPRGVSKYHMDAENSTPRRRYRQVRNQWKGYARRYTHRADRALMRKKHFDNSHEHGYARNR